MDLEHILHLYGGVGHSFTNPAIDAFALPGFFYQAEADRRSWAALLDLFGEAF
ncbi:MAG TPA: dienelactone hydrolase family protein [Allosphingosinicella sp.]|jgi:dienelactone hydrolase